jgi:hypothetical protein
MTKALKTLKALQKNGVAPAEPPKLESEPPHRRLARLTSEQIRLVEEIQSHKSAWADRNRVAQDTHQPPATPEIQAFKAIIGICRPRWLRSTWRSDRSTGEYANTEPIWRPGGQSRPMFIRRRDLTA